MTGKWAVCNLDGKPIHPADKVIIETFRIWLEMDNFDRYWAIKLDPEWRRFTGIAMMGKDYIDTIDYSGRTFYDDDNGEVIYT